MLIVMVCHCRTLFFVIHTKKANIHNFKNETMDKKFILYDAVYASFFSPFVSYVFSSVPMGLIQ